MIYIAYRVSNTAIIRKEAKVMRKSWLKNYLVCGIIVLMCFLVSRCLDNVPSGGVV